MTVLLAFTTAIALTFAGVGANNSWRLEKVEGENKYYKCIAHYENPELCDDSFKEIDVFGDGK